MIRPAGLAAVHDRFFQAAPVRAALQRFSLFPAQLHGLLFQDSLTFWLPRRQTEYLTGNPAISWTDSGPCGEPAAAGHRALQRRPARPRRYRIAG
jgi:hypothetical protein